MISQRTRSSRGWMQHYQADAQHAQAGQSHWLPECQSPRKSSWSIERYIIPGPSIAVSLRKTPS
eukprot:15363-Heterococcus_DN1.PRE.1